MHKQAYLQKIANRPERRKYLRLNNGAMSIVVKRKGLVFELIKGEEVDWLNFNQYGLAFATTSRFDINEELVIDIHLEGVSLNGLSAVVHNARRQSGKFRYGVQFYFGANSYMQSPDVLETLIDIEQSLK